MGDNKPAPACNHCGETYPCHGVLWGTHTFKGEEPEQDYDALDDAEAAEVQAEMEKEDAEAARKAEAEAADVSYLWEEE